jgi:hypothetical protein
MCACVVCRGIVEIVFSTLMSQIVHVVSIDDVPKILVSVMFQSNDVNGAQNSEFLVCVMSRQQAEREVKKDTARTLLRHMRRSTVLVDESYCQIRI